MFDVVDLRVVEGRVVNQNLDGVGAPIDNALHGNVRQEVGQAAGLRVVVTAGFISQQQPCVGASRFGGGQAPLGIEQDGAGVRSQNFRHGDLELAHHFIRDLTLVDAFAGGQRFLQAASLVHGGGGDHAR